MLAIYSDAAFVLFFHVSPPLVFCFCLSVKLDHVITRRASCLLCGYCAFITFDVTRLGDSCHVLSQGREAIVMCH